MRASFDGILNLCSVLVALVLVFMMLAVAYEVVMRYFFVQPTLWVLEIVEWSLVWIAFLSAAWVLRAEGHVKMDIILERLNPRVQTIINVITSILGALVCLTLVWYSSQVTWDHFVRGVLEPRFLPVPKAPLLIIIPIGTFLLLIQFLRRAFNFLGAWREPRLEEEKVVKETATL